jgi:hypothetical protein
VNQTLAGCIAGLEGDALTAVGAGLFFAGLIAAAASQVPPVAICTGLRPVIHRRRTSPSRPPPSCVRLASSTTNAGDPPLS